MRSRRPGRRSQGGPYPALIAERFGVSIGAQLRLPAAEYAAYVDHLRRHPAPDPYLSRQIAELCTLVYGALAGRSAPRLQVEDFAPWLLPPAERRGWMARQRAQAAERAAVVREARRQQNVAAVEAGRTAIADPKTLEHVVVVEEGADG